MKCHYYRLAGASLNALDRLIEYDSLRNRIENQALMDQLEETLGFKPDSDPETKARNMTAAYMTMMTDFHEAQIRDYQSMLGFTNPPVCVRNYGDGALYRAYRVMPKIAMNPGTSKKALGLINAFNEKDVSASPPQARLALYTAHEDYKGNHFVPPGAVEITPEEFAAYDVDREKFEYYRTYDEGVATPADFDPAMHQTATVVAPDSFKFTHAFLTQGDTQKALIDYDRDDQDFIEKYQDFRRFVKNNLLQGNQVTAHRFDGGLVWIDEAADDHDSRALQLTISSRDWNAVQRDFENIFTVKSVESKPMNGCKVCLIPRPDTAMGQKIQAELDKVPVKPRRVDFGFDDEAGFDNVAAAFPYMKIERYGDERLLAFRMPSYITRIDPPQDCETISASDYIALGGDETDPPTHVFRLRGKTRDGIMAHDSAVEDYRRKVAALQQKFESLMRDAYPAATLDQFKPCTYKTKKDSRNIYIVMPKETYDVIKSTLEDVFTFRYADPVGMAEDYIDMAVVPRQDTERGRDFADAVKAVPYGSYLPGPLGEALGFYGNGGSHLMRIQNLEEIKQKIILYYLPPYITGVEAPEGAIPLRKAEYALLLAESVDIYNGSSLSPRPPGFDHLPLPQGYGKIAYNKAMREDNDKDGLPLHWDKND
jgi:hypothetical protein